MRGPVLLVADDDAGILGLIRRVAASRGLAVETVSNATDLVAAWRAKRGSVVLTDVAMPGPMDGIDAALELRRLDARARVWVMTGDAGSERRAREQGLAFAFRKPFSLRTLVEWLEGLGEGG